ncbi:MAG: hypothetical protein PHY72_04100 [Candidatus Pacebacteria bacterium]|nr:hypothetical protein [Candidatus Paceibacterota bacterium]
MKSFKDVVYRILKEAGKALYSKEIVRIGHRLKKYKVKNNSGKKNGVSHHIFKERTVQEMVTDPIIIHYYKWQASVDF